MTLKETKNKVAQDLGYEDWKELVKDQSNFGDAWFDLIVTNVAELHSIEKVKEALKLAAERAQLHVARNNDREDSIRWSYQDHYMGNDVTVYKQSILSLETELIENIKNEK